MTAFTQLHVPLTAVLRRPRSLIRAANAGQSSWRRGRHLTKLLRLERVPKPEAALNQLLAEEAKQNEARIMQAPSYDIQRHVLLMIAILAELRAISQFPVSAPGTANPEHP